MRTYTVVSLALLFRLVGVVTALSPSSQMMFQKNQKSTTKSSSDGQCNIKLGPLSSRHGSKTDRRSFFSSIPASVAAASACSLAFVDPSLAVVTDETDNFATNWWSSGKEFQPNAAPPAPPQPQAIPTDEVTIKVSKADLKARGGLGLELADIEFRTNIRVYVKSIRPGSYAENLGIQKDWVVVAINGQSMERTNAQGVALYLSKAVKAADDNDVVEFRFRDPSVFREKLQNMGTSGGGGEEVTTQVAPAGDTTQRNEDGSVKQGRSLTSQQEQKITVSQLIPPKLCKRGATTDDLLEISYIGRVLDTGAIFDGSAVKIDGRGVPGRGDDVSLYFVLGKQPFGQFPPGWDVGLVGMCVGERRRLIVPPALAYGSTGVPKRNIPPDATLQYDITLVSLNGLSTPQ